MFARSRTLRVHGVHLRRAVRQLQVHPHVHFQQRLQDLDGDVNLPMTGALPMIGAFLTAGVAGACAGARAAAGAAAGVPAGCAVDMLTRVLLVLALRRIAICSARCSSVQLAAERCLSV
jgi:hypothetical protein